PPEGSGLSDELSSRVAPVTPNLPALEPLPRRTDHNAEVAPSEEVPTMQFIELVLLRLLAWVGLPVALAVLAIGPAKVWRGVKRGWNWLFGRRLDPQEALNQVVEGHQKHVASLKQVQAQSEAAEADIQRSLKKTEDNIAELEAEAV